VHQILELSSADKRLAFGQRCTFTPSSSEIGTAPPWVSGSDLGDAICEIGRVNRSLSLCATHPRLGSIN
jgi:hypothetical protein